MELTFPQQMLNILDKPPLNHHKPQIQKCYVLQIVHICHILSTVGIYK